MALAETTLSSAVGVDDTEIVVASATDVAAGRFIWIDQECMKVAQNYSSGTTVDVIRGQNGTKTASHVSSARVVHGTGEDFGRPAEGQVVQRPIAGRTRELKSYIAAGAITLPTPGNDMLAVILGSSALAMTLANPGKDLDGCILTITSAGKAAHTVTYTAGLGDSGAGVDVATWPTGGRATLQLVAWDEIWTPVASPFEGTVTAIDVSVA